VLLSEQSDDFMKKATEVARRYFLQEPRLPHFPANFDTFPILRSLDELLSLRHTQRNLLLPDLSSFNSLAIFSDYSGEQKGSEYRTYSFLVTGDGATGHYSEVIREIRDANGIPPLKEIAYKDLGYGPVNRSLTAILDAADQIPGLLFTLAVHRDVASLFKKSPRDVSQLLSAQGSLALPPAVAEKSLRIVLFLVYLGSLLGRDGQRIFWFSDQDDIISDKARTNNLLRIFDGAPSAISQTKFSGGGLASQAPKSKRSTSDLKIDVDALLSIPDLFAGVLIPVLSQWRNDEPKTVKSGAGKIIEMLCHQGVFLKKLVYLIEPHPEGMSGSILDFKDNSEAAGNRTVILI